MDRLSESKKETYRWHLNQVASSQNQLTIARISEGGRERLKLTPGNTLCIYIFYFLAIASIVFLQVISSMI